MLNQKNIVVSTLTLTCALAIGCSSESSDPPAENTGSRAEALTGEVEEARARPTGDLANGNADGVLGAFAEIDYAIGDAGMPCDLDPFDFEGASECAIDQDGNDLDVSCVSSGAASGTTSVDIHIRGGDTYVHYMFDNVCAADRDVCVTGEGAVKVSSTGEVIVAGELTTTREGVTNELKYGVTVTSLGVEVVVWHNGDSYVVNTTAGGLDIEDASGGFDCDLDGELDDFTAELSGSCAGAAQFDF